MIIDANAVDPRTFENSSFDVCVCGAGVAGITLALQLARRGKKVILMESGGEEYSEESQSIYKGERIGQDYFALDFTRLRFFGGSSNHWGGLCRPLDTYDFETKPYHDWTGWPIRRGDIDPYLAEAKKILDINDEQEFWEHRFDFVPNTLQEIDLWFSPPTRFAEKYRDEIENHPNLLLVLHANLVDIRINDTGSYVSNLIFRNYKNSREIKLKARQHVLCLGGLENPRILLNSNQQAPAGIGNENGLVGRFFTEHPHFTPGGCLLNEELISINFGVIVSPAKSFLLQNQIMNFGLRILPIKKKSSTATANFRHRLREMRHTTVNEASDWEGFDATFKIAYEQAPNFDSKVRLSNDTDPFGLKRIQLDWQLSEVDKRTMLVAVQELGIQFALRDYGRVRISDWLLQEELQFPDLGKDEVAGHHHMCTTRMADTPARGVVDSNLKVFGLDNLFIGGSSVFATAGHANPTLTIVQLTLRLAEHLESRLARA